MRPLYHASPLQPHQVAQGSSGSGGDGGGLISPRTAGVDVGAATAAAAAAAAAATGGQPTAAAYLALAREGLDERRAREGGEQNGWGPAQLTEASRPANEIAPAPNVFWTGNLGRAIYLAAAPRKAHLYGACLGGLGSCQLCNPSSSSSSSSSEHHCYIATGWDCLPSYICLRGVHRCLGLLRLHLGLVCRG
eukprot:COSAG01_NODE_2147_length_8301_cov_6.653621_1_plen_192_part_00